MTTWRSFYLFRKVLSRKDWADTVWWVFSHLLKVYVLNFKVKTLYMVSVSLILSDGSPEKSAGTSLSVAKSDDISIVACWLQAVRTEAMPTMCPTATRSWASVWFLMHTHNASSHLRLLQCTYFKGDEVDWDELCSLAYVQCNLTEGQLFSFY